MKELRIATTSGRGVVWRGVPSQRKLAMANRVPRNRLGATKAPDTVSQPPPITVTENALTHLKTLKANRNEDALLLRIGVRSGGCNGMSYQMDFEQEQNVSSDDMVVEVDDGEFRMVCDTKSLLYLFGMQLDYSDALVGGGFQFQNPNATDSCGCGKSFGV
ncbi:hypothetical protein BSKO_07334 [Bryopsis sp. KO-2023]|nr:hypothetical protein BSKO_07334 [Bryopsis sp. KO-2023]